MAAEYFLASTKAGIIGCDAAAFIGDSSPEAEVVGRFLSMGASVFAEWHGASLDAPNQIIEKEMLGFGADFVLIAIGHPDIVWIDHKRALVLDLKSLYGDHTRSIENLQLRTYAVLVAEEYGCTEVTVAICQPRVSGTPQLCVYDADDLRRARAQLFAIDADSKAPAAPRIPGEKQCSFCRARTICPEANATVTTLATLATREIEPVALARMLDVIGPAKKVIAAIESRARRLLEDDPNALEGWTLEEGASRRTITDPQAAYDALKDIIEPGEFAATCSVKISELETLHRKKTGLKVKDAKPDFEQRLNGCIERKANAPSLARLKPALKN